MKTWYLTSDMEGHYIVFGSTDENNYHAYIIADSALKHRNEERCPFRNMSEEEYCYILGDTAQKIYYGVQKPEGFNCPGDWLFYSTSGDSNFESEIGISYKNAIILYDDNGDAQEYEYAMIFHALIPRTSEFEDAIAECIIKGGQEWRKYNVQSY